VIIRAFCLYIIVEEIYYLVFSAGMKWMRPTHPTLASHQAVDVFAFWGDLIRIGCGIIFPILYWRASIGRLPAGGRKTWLEYESVGLISAVTLGLIYQIATRWSQIGHVIDANKAFFAALFS
jgi:hypothetical protein